MKFWVIPNFCRLIMGLALGVSFFSGIVSNGAEFDGPGNRIDETLSGKLIDEECPEVDYRKHFGGLKNQGFHQICWAMAASSLLEEEACLMNPSLCGLSLSAVDITSCNLKIGHIREEGVVDRGIQCAQQNGLCPTEFAPFVDFRLKGSLLATVLGVKKMQKSKLFETFEKFKYRSLHPINCDNCLTIETKEKLKSQFLNEFREMFPKSDLTNEETIAILDQAKDGTAFIDKVIIPKTCKENRIQFPNIYSTFVKLFSKVNPRILNYYTKSEIDQFEERSGIQPIVYLKNRLLNGRSLSISICPEKFSYIEDIMIPGGNCVAGHAVVANALRRNPQTKKCEIHLLDSRLEAFTVQFNGWFDLKDVADATFSISQIVPVK